MSADNFLYMCHPDIAPDKYIVVMGFASPASEEPESYYERLASVDPDRPHKEYPVMYETFEEALSAAHQQLSQEVVEYGLEIAPEIVEEQKVKKEAKSLRIQRMRETLDWIISLDDPANEEERRSVTLNEVIVRARTAVKEPS